MNIISREAELKYPEGIPGMDPAPLRSAYMDGAGREPTDVEVEAAAIRLFYMGCNASGLFFDLDWNRLPEANKANYRSCVRGILAAIHAKATQEEKTA